VLGAQDGVDGTFGQDLQPIIQIGWMPTEFNASRIAHDQTSSTG
jgi:hypothetical protein